MSSDNTRWAWLALLLLAIYLAVSALQNRPLPLEVDGPSGKFNSLSFAPYRECCSPLEKKYPAPEHIAEDMRLLADMTERIRTYSSLEGIENSHGLARELGLKMIQGAWITQNADAIGMLHNKKERAALIKAANEHPDVIERVIVGNEVLLRGEMLAADLIEEIRQVKSRVSQPVSYADVWSMYLKHPELIKEVDYITIHILPYWEDEPIPASEAAAHLEKVLLQVKQEADAIAPGKPILIGETGWPSRGRQRGEAEPSQYNQALYLRAFVQLADRLGLDYNLVEAFDQPWKAQLEGVVGARWGLFDKDRELTFPMHGPVQENPSWLQQTLIELAVWLLALLAGSRHLSKPAGQLDVGRQAFFLLTTLLMASTFVHMLRWGWTDALGLGAQIKVLIVATLGALTGWTVSRTVLERLRGDVASNWLDAALRLLLCVTAVWALAHSVGLAVNGRYLSFPNWQISAAAVGVVLLAISQRVGASAQAGGTGHRPLHSAVSPANDADQRTQHGAQQGSVRPASGAGSLPIEVSGIEKGLAALLALGALAVVVGETRAFAMGRDLIAAHPDVQDRWLTALHLALVNNQLQVWCVCLLLLAFGLYRRV